MDFRTFNSTFSLLVLVALSSIAWLSVRFLAPQPVSPTIVAIGTAWLWLSLPFTYGMELTQTHPLFILAALSALLLAEREHPVSAGVLLSIAATVKITPALLVLYWLTTRRWRAIASFMIASTALVILTLFIAGPELTLEYIGSIRRVSNTLLIANNNHSFPAFIMAPSNNTLTTGWQALPLSPLLMYVSLAIATTVILLSGWIRLHGGNESATVSLALLSMTVFAPIAWSHYYVIFVVPLIWMISHRRLRAWAVLIALMSCAPDTMTRTLFLAGIVTIAVLLSYLIYWSKSAPHHDQEGNIA